MSRAFDVVTLFARPRRRPPTTRDAYGAAMRAGGSDLRTLVYEAGRREPPHEPMVGWAVGEGLAVVLAPVRRAETRQIIGMFVVALEQLWRVPAITAFRDANVEGAELRTDSLGTVGAILRARPAAPPAGRNRPAVAGFPIHLLLAASQLARLDATGYRSFGADGAVLVGATVFAGVHHLELRPRAAALVPRGRTLARVGITQDAFTAIFGNQTTRGPFRAVITREVARTVNAGLRMTIELYGTNGWETP